ncbi:MAG: hypothetical protein ACP5D8_08405 [Fidelibacterota bacterium]
MLNDELNAERSEAVERHKVPLEFLIATSWCSSTSLRSVFKCCCADLSEVGSWKLEVSVTSLLMGGSGAQVPTVD